MMTFGRNFRRFSLTLASLCAAASPAWAQAAPGDQRVDRDQLQEPVYKQPAAAANATENAAAQSAETEHPLIPALKMAYSSMEACRQIKDYSATMVKRERINDKLGDFEYMFIKVRHEPFSAYTYFLAPESLKGQEAIYVEGRNDGNLLGHGVGIRKIAGTVALKPTSMLAMQGQRYPITEIGVYNLTKRLIEVGENDKQYGECDVKFFKGAKINGRVCTCIQVVHPVPRRNFMYHMARVFLDDELNVPIRFEAYDWPATPGSQAPLIEEYTYVNLKVNNNFTDADWDVNNPNYKFR